MKVELWGRLYKEDEKLYSFAYSMFMHDTEWGARHREVEDDPRSKFQGLLSWS